VAGKKGAVVRVEWRYCKRCQVETEHREYVRRNREYVVDDEGNRRHTEKRWIARQWRCYVCRVAAIRRYQVKQGIDVGRMSGGGDDSGSAGD